MKNGWHEGLSMEEYLALHRVSSSRLNTLRTKTPAHLRAEILDPKPPTKAMALGSVAHTAVLEPDDLSTRYMVAEQCEALTQKGTQCTKGGQFYHLAHGWLCGQHMKGYGLEEADQDREVVSQSDWDRASAMRDAVWAHPAAKALLSRSGPLEVSGLWKDPETGLACKIRPDKRCDAHGVIVDLKTTTDASPRGFSKVVADRGYFVSGALYRMGAEALGWEWRDHVFIAVEKTPPYAVAVYRLDLSALADGDRVARQLLRQYGAYEAAGEWPSYPPTVQDIGLPTWAERQVEEAFPPEEIYAA